MNDVWSREKANHVKRNIAYIFNLIFGLISMTSRLGYVVIHFGLGDFLLCYTNSRA